MIVWQCHMSLDSDMDTSIVSQCVIFYVRRKSCFENSGYRCSIFLPKVYHSIIFFSIMKVLKTISEKEVGFHGTIHIRTGKRQDFD